MFFVINVRLEMSCYAGKNTTAYIQHNLFLILCSGSGGSEELSAGAIVGIVFFVLFMLCLLLVLALFLYRHQPWIRHQRFDGNQLFHFENPLYSADAEGGACTAFFSDVDPTPLPLPSIVVKNNI